MKFSIASKVAIFSLLIVACNSSSTGDQVTRTTSDGYIYTPDINDNACAIFDDDDGQMARLYEAYGYHYSDDLELAAASGDPGAQTLLASMYAYGIGGVEPNRKKAYCLYRSLAEAGDAEAGAIVGYMMLYGFGPIEDTDAALEWLVRAANSGSGFAYYILGNFYNYNVEKDKSTEARALLYYQMAVERGIDAAGEELQKIQVAQ